MESPAIHCPECGAPAPFRGPAVSLVCEYCGSTVVRTGVDVRLVGKVSAIVDNGSPILLGSRGAFDGVPFEVAGRLQIVHARGTWNEWFLTFADGTVAWLADAMGQYAVVRPWSKRLVADAVPGFAAMAINVIHEIDGREYLVVDKRTAAYRGAEGILPFEAEPGMSFHAVDLRGFDGAFLTLDWGTDPAAEPTPWSGRAVELDDLRLHPLRRYEGWRELA